MKKLTKGIALISLFILLLSTNISNVFAVEAPKVYDNVTETLELSGVFTADGEDGAIWAKNGTRLTINGTDETEVNATLGATGYSMAIWANGENTTVTINGGKYTNATDGTERGTDLIYASGNAKIEINGGIFEAATTKWTLNCRDNTESTITVRGGKYYKFDPSNAEVGEGEVIVADGYKVVQDGDWYSVVCAHENWDEYAAKEATCTEGGNVKYYICKNCNEIQAELNGERVVVDNISKTEIAATGHKLTVVPAKEATCTEEGNVKYSICENCNEIQAELNGETVVVDDISKTKIAATGHKLTLVPAKEATYKENGTKEYYVCGCGKWFADAEAKTEITDKNSIVVPQLVNVEGDKVEVTEDAVNNAVEEATKNNSETVVLPLKEASETVKSVDVSTESLKTVIDADKTLTVETSEVIATFDQKALEEIVKQAGDTDVITIDIIKVAEAVLNAEQKEAIKDKEVSAIISANILFGDKTISNFNGGKVTVTIPFELGEDEKGSDFEVLYIADDGSIETIAANYVDGHFVVELEHFSEYVIAKNTNNTDIPKEDDNKDDDNKTGDVENEDKTGNVPQTGDEFNIVLWSTILIVSVFGFIKTIKPSKKSNHKGTHSK